MLFAVYKIYIWQINLILIKMMIIVVEGVLNNFAQSLVNWASP